MSVVFHELSIPETEQLSLRFLYFVVLFFRVDIPDCRFIMAVTQDAFYGFEGCHHGMIKIVIAVLAVTPDAVEVVDGVQVGDQCVGFRIGVKIGGILFMPFRIGT